MLNLVATFVLGFAVPALIMVVLKAFAIKAPKGVLLLIAGATMIFYTIWVEYSWHMRVLDGLPDDVKVVKKIRQSRAYAPWTYLYPRVERLIAVDEAETKTHPRQPGYVITRLYLADRQQENATVIRIYHCSAQRFADLPPTTAFDADGLPRDAAWVSVESEDPVFTHVCP